MLWQRHEIDCMGGREEAEPSCRLWEGEGRKEEGADAGGGGKRSQRGRGRVGGGPADDENCPAMSAPNADRRTEREAERDPSD